MATAPQSNGQAQKVPCDPCSYEGRFVEAAGYCYVCVEYLCVTCVNAHRKMKVTRAHEVVDLSAPSDIGLRLGDSNTHSTKTLQDTIVDLSAPSDIGLSVGDTCTHSTKTPQDTVCPGRPWATGIQPDSITLTWDPPTNFKEDDYYQISYKETNKDRKWKLHRSEHTTTSVTITRLKPNTKFVFRVRVVHTDGEEGPYSQESEEIQTPPSHALRLTEISRIVKENEKSPTIYVLPFTEIKEARNVRAKTKRLTLGNPPPGGYVESKTILLVGATGTGKSTFVDGIVNYVLGVTWEDSFRFTTDNLEDEELARIENQALSQTEWIKCYTINPENGSRLNYQLHIIDTPGFGDTRGLQRDQELTEQIREVFSEKDPKGITDIDAVCFLIKAPDSRLTALQYYIFQSVMEIFGKDIENNICSAITFADGRDPPVLAALRESRIPFGKWFPFNNSCLVARNDADIEASLAPLFWDMGMTSFFAFFKYLDQLQSKSLQLTHEVLRERLRLQTIFRNLKESLDIMLSIINILKQEKKIIGENKSLTEENKDFEYEVEETQQIKMLLPGGAHNTNCKHCILNCHMNCSCQENGGESMCKVINSKGFCEVCPGKCHWKHHERDAYKYEIVVVKVKRTCADMQAKYSKAEGKVLTHIEIVEKNEQKLKDLTHHVEEMIFLIKDCNQRLQEIALKPNPITVIEYIDLLIEEENMAKKDGYLEKIALLKELRESLDIPRRLERSASYPELANRKNLSDVPVEAVFQRIAIRLRSYVPNYKF